MALRWAEGFESHQDPSTSLLRRYHSTSTWGGATFPASSGRGTGNFNKALVANPASPTTLIRNFSVADEHWFMGMALILDGPDAGDFLIFRSGATVQCEFEIQAVHGGGFRFLFKNGAGDTLGSSAVIPNSPLWRYFEFSAVINPSMGTGRILVDGVDVLTSFSGFDTTAGTGILTVNTFALTLNPATSGTVNLDDLYLCDSTESENNDFLGDIVVFGRTVLSDATPNDWTPSSGTNHAALVDEQTNDDGNTTTLATAVDDEVELFNPEAQGSINGDILGVQLCVIGRLNTGSPACKVQLVCLENAVQTEKDGTSASGVFASGYGEQCVFFDRQPSNGLPWTVAAFNAADWGFRADLSAGANTITVTRVSEQIVAVNAAAPANKVRVTRVAAEVMAQLGTPKVRVTRVAAEVLALIPPPKVRTTRVAAEVMALAALKQVTPLPLPDVMPPHFPIQWEDGVRLETTYRTAIDRSKETSAEDRQALAGRPVRTVSVDLLALRRERTDMLRVLAMRRAHQRAPFPLHCDQTCTSQVSPADGTTLWCDARFRRFFRGQRVLVHTWEADEIHVPKDPLYLEVANVFDDRLVLALPLAADVPTESRVIPLIDADVELEVDGDLQTDDKLVVSMSAGEVPGPSALPPTTEGPPDVLPLNDEDGRPIFNVRPDWADSLGTVVVRPGESYELGRGQVVSPDGDRPLILHQPDFHLRSRESAWTVVRTFDFCLGRTDVFWIVAPNQQWEVVDVQATHVDIVKGRKVLEDLEDLYRHVGIELNDGTLFVRGIASVADLGAELRLTFSSAIAPPALADVYKVTSAHLVRPESDTLDETWATSEGPCRIDMPMREVDREEDVEVDLGDVDDDFSGPDDVSNLVLWVDASRNLYRALQDDGTGFFEKATPHRTRLAYPSLDFKSPNPIQFQGYDIVGTWDDVRAKLGQDPPQRPWLQPGGGLSEHLRVVAFPTRWVNNGRVTIPHPQSVSATEQDWDLLPRSTVLHSNTLGCTIFAVFIAEGLFTPVEGFILDKAGVLQWEYSVSGGNQVRFYNPFGVLNAANTIGVPDLRAGQKHIMTMTWSPSAYARVYFNGALDGFAATPIAAVATDEQDMRAFDFRTSYTEAMTPMENIGAARGHYTNGLLVFDRALTTQELNDVGEFLAERYGVDWTTIT